MQIHLKHIIYSPWVMYNIVLYWGCCKRPLLLVPCSVRQYSDGGRRKGRTYEKGSVYSIYINDASEIDKPQETETLL